jgi:hypothetical protein
VASKEKISNVRSIYELEVLLSAKNISCIITEYRDNPLRKRPVGTSKAGVRVRQIGREIVTENKVCLPYFSPISSDDL